MQSQKSNVCALPPQIQNDEKTEAPNSLANVLLWPRPLKTAPAAALSPERRMGIVVVTSAEPAPPPFTVGKPPPCWYGPCASISTPTSGVERGLPFGLGS